MRRIHSQLFLLPLLSVFCICDVNAEEPAAADFDQTIAPLLAQRCLSCHSGDDPKGKLNLASRETAMAGGESGPSIERQNPDNSLLWQYIESDEMPPKKPLSVKEKATLKQWINDGAIWGTETIDPFRFSTNERAGVDWWSFRPLQNPIPPQSQNSDWAMNPIDRFVIARLNDAQLTPSPEADRHIQIRRLSFDLLGLPPTPSEINGFVQDTSEHAYENLVDRLLKSPHYGERWARHWLDIVRFGESNGFEYDQPRDNAWPYRNWVIHALNQDMPYNEFVRLQLAGDIMQPNDINAAAAAGFLVAGPHNTTLPSNDKMRMSMAQDELEDLVGIVSQTFLGLTANCARCHDHKFDPISQKEYYQLAATLTGVTHGERKITTPLATEQQDRLAEINAHKILVENQINSIETEAKRAIVAERENGAAQMIDPPAAMACWEFDKDLKDSLGSLDATANGSAKIENGCLVLNGQDAFAATKPLATDLTEKTLEAWVQLDNLDQRGGGVISVQTLDGVTFDAIVYGEREPQKWMAGSNGFVRTRPFRGSDDAEAATHFVHVAIVYQTDGTVVGYRNGELYGEAYRPGDVHNYHASQTQVIFGMRHAPAGGNRMLAGRIQRAQLYDRALSPDEVAASAGVVQWNHVSETDLLARLTTTQRQDREQLKIQLTEIQLELEAMTSSQMQSLYTCISSNPGVTRLLKRGDVGSPAEEMSPAGLDAIPGQSADFGLAPNATDAERRLKLADWVTHSDNPLFARVIVNRLWHYHFGRGMVTTPSDFGFNGGQPSHPQLLDWLAQQLRIHNYRLKPIHRLMVMSATYRQASTVNPAAVRVDANNRWLWRKSPLRLEAEEIRDAVLVATDHWNPEIGGRGYRDVRHFPFKGSNFYESINESETDVPRRTVYRFSPRGGRNPFLDTFDCPDPSATSPQRASTTTPLQALALMNNDLVFKMADRFSLRIQNEAGNNTADQIALVYQIAYGRTANDEETELGTSFIKRHGLTSYCRVVMNSNEFLYVQ